MTNNTQRRNETDTGAGRQGGGHRARGWIMAVMLVGLGAAGGALTTIAVGAGAHGGWHDRFRMHGHGHGHAASVAHATERLQRVSAWVLDTVDATDEQRERIDAILAGRRDRRLSPARRSTTQHRASTWIAELCPTRQSTATELERIRAAELVARGDRRPPALLDATVALAEVLAAGAAAAARHQRLAGTRALTPIRTTSRLKPSAGPGTAGRSCRRIRRRRLRPSRPDPDGSSSQPRARPRHGAGIAGVLRLAPRSRWPPSPRPGARDAKTLPQPRATACGLLAGHHDALQYRHDRAESSSSRTT